MADGTSMFPSPVQTPVPTFPNMHPTINRRGSLINYPIFDNFEPFTPMDSHGSYPVEPGSMGPHPMNQYGGGLGYQSSMRMPFGHNRMGSQSSQISMDGGYIRKASVEYISPFTPAEFPHSLDFIPIMNTPVPGSVEAPPYLHLSSTLPPLGLGSSMNFGEALPDEFFVQKDEWNAARDDMIKSYEDLLSYKRMACPNIQKNHAWKKCNNFHKEKARRDPSKKIYSNIYCDEFKRDQKLWNCSRNDDCPFMHTKEEELYHPLSWKTQKCRHGLDCQNKFCSFYHTTWSPLVEFPEMRQLILAVMGLTSLKTAELSYITADFKAAFYNLVTAMGGPSDGTEHSRACGYIHIWMRSWFEQSQYYKRVGFADFVLTKANIILKN